MGNRNLEDEAESEKNFEDDDSIKKISRNRPMRVAAQTFKKREIVPRKVTEVSEKTEKDELSDGSEHFD